MGYKDNFEMHLINEYCRIAHNIALRYIPVIPIATGPHYLK